MPLFKYIITDEGAILFNENTVHKTVAKGFKKVYAAGFVRIKVMHRDVDIEVYGESDSLKIKSQPEIDRIIIGDLFATVSQIKYFNMKVKDWYDDDKIH